MATITLEYDAHNSNLKKVLDLLVSLGAKVVSTPAAPKTATKEMTELESAMQEARDRKVNHYKNLEDMFQQLGI